MIGLIMAGGKGTRMNSNEEKLLLTYKKPVILHVVDALQKGLNYASFVGHSALRTYAMGDRAMEEEATHQDMAVMERELGNSLRAGALGLSTSRTKSCR